MTDNERFSESVPEDVEGHGRIMDTQTGEDDVEGHRSFIIDTQTGEDDAEGHRIHTVDTQAGEDDVEGHQHSGAIRPDVYGDAGRTP